MVIQSPQKIVEVCWSGVHVLYSHLLDDSIQPLHVVQEENVEFGLCNLLLEFSLTHVVVAESSFG